MVFVTVGSQKFPFDRMVELDLDYIGNRSIGLDLSLVLSTVKAMFSGKGAR